MQCAVVCFLVLLACGLARAQSAEATLYQTPALSKSHIVFVYAGDLWIVPREGGEARRLTTGVGIEVNPLFSPDGSTIAFTGEYDGNTDVYTVPAQGGVPRRLTYHPGIDVAVSWSPDGSRILFRSQRSSYSGRFDQLYSMPVAGGGLPGLLPLPMGEEGVLSADGSMLAYVPYWNRRAQAYNYISWKRYRGGLASPVWIARLSDSSVEKLPREKSNDFNPLWVGNRIYFLSDRNGAVTLFYYETSSKKVAEAVKNSGADIRWASAGPGAIAYEQFGSIFLYDLNSAQVKKVNIRLSGDLPGVRPRFERVGSRATNASLSPTGKRAVFEARGEIFTVPAEKGDPRDITNTPGSAERYPAWSPDGKWIAYLSDESGEYALHLRDQSGMGEAKKIPLGEPPSHFYNPAWSPDSRKIALTDKRLNLWCVEVDKGAATKVDTDLYDHPVRSLDPAWSPDSKWITYTKRLKSQLHAVFVYSLDGAKSTQITDGLSDARFPAFDKNGKYLYFTASTDFALNTGWLDMTSIGRPSLSNVYLIVLSKKDPSPLAPESDEEKVEEPKPEKKEAAPPAEPKAAAKDAAPAVTVDFEGINQRILALPIPARSYAGLSTGKTGIIFLIESQPVALPGVQGATLHRFELDKRKVEKVLDGISYFDVSFNGEKMMYRQGERWFIVAAAQPVRPNEGAIRVDAMEMRVDPRAEWRQMYREMFRIERDFLYDPGAHGLNLKATEKKYEPYLDAVAHRADLNYLFDEILGQLTLGHTYVGGGDTAQARAVPGGLLGADFKIENARYRFARVFDGENWNPTLRAPLTAPGVNVKAGDYLLAVNGRDLRATDNVYAFLESTANKTVVLRVGPNPDGSGSRDVTISPVGTEGALRNFAWVEDNRRKVDQITGGRVAYVYLPNTGGGGWQFFNRYYFAQLGKDGVVIDERFNGGGSVADYFIDYLRRPLLFYLHTREGADFTHPFASIYGPKAMIINEFAGSGGDALPWMFRQSKIGTLIGKRTWGGLVGIYDYPVLIDGGTVQAPRIAFASLNGGWEVENAGVAPDIEVDLDPKLVREGKDPQLERAVQWVLDELKKNPPPQHKRPPYPVYNK